MPSDSTLTRVLFALVAIVYALPFLVSLSLPFAYWDWLMTPAYQLRDQAHLWRAFPGNILFTIFQDPIQFRPISAIFVNLEYLVFRGEFWLWYVAKWAVFITCVYLVFASVRLITRSARGAFVAALYFALHPMPFVLDVISQDAFVVLFATASLYWLGAKTKSGDGNPGRLTALTTPQFLVFFALAALAVFSKEIGIAYLVALFIFLLTAGELPVNKRLIVRYASLAALALFCLVRIAQIRHPTSQLGHLASGESWMLLRTLFGQSARACGYLLPRSAGSSLLVAAGLLLCGGFALFKTRRDLLPLMIFAAVGLVGSLAIIGTAYSCPKYMPVPVMFFAVLLGATTAALEAVWTRVARGLAVCFAVLMVLSAPPKIFSQWLGMMQSLYEMADTINFMETKDREGYQLAASGLVTDHEIPWETAATFREFFTHSSVRWYGYEKPIDFKMLKYDGVPASGRFVLLTSILPEQIAKGALASVGIADLSGVAGVYRYERERYGAFENVTRWMKRRESKLGMDLSDPIDCQPPHPSRFGPGMPNPMHAFGYFPLHAGPHLLYVFDLHAAPAQTPPSITPLAPLRRYGAFAR